MLRWFQSTVRIRGGYGGPGIRPNLCQKVSCHSALHLSAVKLKDSDALASTNNYLRRPIAHVDNGHYSPHSELCQEYNTLTPASTHASPSTPGNYGGNRAQDIDILRRYLSSSGSESLAPESLVTLYESARAQSLLTQLTATQMSTLISIFGSLSLPQDAPHIRNTFVSREDGASSTPYWPFVLEMAADKKRLGLGISNGDSYWVMWAHILEFRALEGEHATQGSSFANLDCPSHSKPTSSDTDNASRALTCARKYYRKIWRRTKVPDILVPYFEALLSSCNTQHVTDCIHDLLEVLSNHANLHGRFLQLIWRIFILHKDTLSPSAKEELLLCLWNRSSSTNSPLASGRYLATHRFNPLTKQHELLPVDIARLIAVLGAPIFSLFRISVPLSVQQWGRRQVQTVLSPERSVDSRWRSLSFLSLYHWTRAGLEHDPPALNQESYLGDWHVVLVLGLLENVDVPTTQVDEVRNIIHPLWRQWKDLTASDSNRSIFVSRAIASAFLRLAARTRDEYIRNECFHYSLDQGLWATDESNTKADYVQIGALMCDYAEATIRCRGKAWSLILRSFDPRSASEVSKLSSHAGILIKQFLSANPDLALSLYDFCLHTGIPISAETTCALGVGIATDHSEAVIPMFKHTQLASSQTEKLLHAILDSFRLQRRRYLNVRSGRTLGSVIQNLYQYQAPAKLMKYPIRYCLPLLITAGCAVTAVRIIELVYPRRQFFFNERFLHRILHALLRSRLHFLAVRLYRLSKGFPVAARDRLRRKLVLGLVRGRASSLAKGYFSRRSRSLREKLAGCVRFRVYTPTRASSLKVLPLLGRNPSNIASIKYAFMILLNSKRPLAALQLIKRSPSNAALTTWFGNVFLHHVFRQFQTRNSLTKKVIRTKNFLEERIGFKPDRVTLNILVKSILHWKRFADPAKVRNLFDDMVRIGYPAGPRWRRENMVPFGTRAVRPALLSNLPSHISFERDVRPMYKMFIKAFYLRHDAASAKTVIGIMKDEEVAAISRQIHRNRRRYEGLQKRGTGSRNK